ncbi:ABC transporter substrate-binding protein [Pseudonocardia oroxyli]|uniref:Peptide/nickel transport system substrate-binding protein n=1 Tax=Pseudonocardia oroxyli TaxID=366584 RepID=A0A1G8CC63_PSEOR|nr:ABC transporter substrate-binding protein [Pseudonocardia oroxyli]SDH42985.1 peptide/nickel transport system substrate-binding protein [Pseudonocardia oroxyli]
MSARSSRALVPAFLAAATLALAACASSATDSAADAGPPQPGGTLRFAVSSDAGCVDPQQVGSNDSIYSLRQIVDSLTDQDPQTGELKPWLATSWETSQDARSYTFTLREGVTFSDGTPLDANAVKANFDRIPQIGARGTLPKGYLAGYAGTTVESPTRFTVSFQQPNVQFLQGTSTHSLGILSPATVAKSDDDRCASAIGSGPFTLREYVKNASLTLAKRPGYDWGSALFAHPGEAYLDTVEFRIVPESGVRTGALQSGEVDAIGNIGQQDEAPLTGAGAQLLARPNPGIAFGIGFNASKPVVSDPAVREALSLAIDRQEVVAGVYTSQTKPATSVLSSTTPGYADQSALVAFDPAKAGSVLDAAGWVPGADGIRVKDGQRLTIPLAFASNAASNKPTLELLQQQVKAAGIDLQVQELQISQVPTIQQSGDFTALWGNLTRADPDILRSSFSVAGANNYRLPETALEPLLIAQAGEPDPAKRAEIVEQAQRTLLEQRFHVPVVELTTVLGVASSVHGITYDASSRIQLHDAWKSR